MSTILIADIKLNIQHRIFSKIRKYKLVFSLKSLEILLFLKTNKYIINLLRNIKRFI